MTEDNTNTEPTVSQGVHLFREFMSEVTPALVLLGELVDFDAIIEEARVAAETSDDELAKFNAGLFGEVAVGMQALVEILTAEVERQEAAEAEGN